jgi:hypothetical protein
MGHFMKMSRLLFWVCITFLIMIPTSCGGDSEDCKSQENSSSCPAPTVIGARNAQSYYKVLADENLSEGHKIAILESLNEWAVKTNHTFRYELSFIDMSEQPQDTSSPHTIKIYVKDPGDGLLGWTSWQPDTYSAYMFVKPSIDDNLFRRVMLHELGHSFNLNFKGNVHYQGPYESVMYPAISNAQHLCCPELLAFCNNYGCQVDCTNVTVSNNTNNNDVILWGESIISSKN